MKTTIASINNSNTYSSISLLKYLNNTPKKTIISLRETRGL